MRLRCICRPSNFDNKRSSSKINYKTFETATHASTSEDTAPSTAEAAATSMVIISARKEADAIATRETAARQQRQQQQQ
jgi:hypothetical protein